MADDEFAVPDAKLGSKKINADEDPSCPFSVVMAPHEIDALDWLHKTLTKIAKQKKHANFARASTALVFMERLAQSQHAAHYRLHELEHVLAIAAANVTGPSGPSNPNVN